jgi:hypothetical protein
MPSPLVRTMVRARHASMPPRRRAVSPQDGDREELRPNPSAKPHQLRNSSTPILLFVESTDYDRLEKNDTLRIRVLRRKLAGGGKIVLESANVTIETEHGLTCDQIEIVLAGGVVNHRRNNRRKGSGRDALTPRSPVDLAEHEI